ncbi:MAG TPA: tRNA (guanosine(37)-N1)-methyltransferase TrmD [Candidatus Acidoferrum sp.]|nr:tRNA (guanosine(37)-N1)-methyltransferase TrmD [Candidatus Acidoferrum sp.]
MFRGPLEESILRRAQENGLVEIRVHDLRAWTHDRHHQVDDQPYGGGAGMVLKPEPAFEAVDELRRDSRSRIVVLSPQGRPFSQQIAEELVREEHLILLCGRYEGFDDRIPQGLGAQELSIGDYVLTGGELPALVVLDAVIRLIPGALGDAASAQTDSFATGFLEYPQFTRPPIYRGMSVPAILLSGDHKAIARWRRKESIRRTLQRRPDLMTRAVLSEFDRELLAEVEEEAAQTMQD